MPPEISISNRLLGALSPDDLDLLRAHLETVPLPQRQTLSSPGASIDQVYFPQEGMVSLVQPLENGTTIGGRDDRQRRIGRNAGPPRCG
jgi:CRP-like cAMP-binding protein